LKATGAAPTITITQAADKTLNDVEVKFDVNTGSVEYKSGEKHNITNSARSLAHDLEVISAAGEIKFRIPLQYLFDIFNVNRFIPSIDKFKIRFVVTSDAKTFIKSVGSNDTTALTSAYIYSKRYTLSEEQNAKIMSKLGYDSKENTQIIYPFRRWVCDDTETEMASGTLAHTHQEFYTAPIRSTYYLHPSTAITGTVSQYINYEADKFIANKSVKLNDNSICDTDRSADDKTCFFAYGEYLNCIPKTEKTALLYDYKTFTNVLRLIVDTQLNKSIWSETGYAFRMNPKTMKLDEKLTFADFGKDMYIRHIVVREDYIKVGKDRKVIINQLV
jgi:hypothetical protein